MAGMFRLTVRRDIHGYLFQPAFKGRNYFCVLDPDRYGHLAFDTSKQFAYIIYLINIFSFFILNLASAR